MHYKAKLSFMVKGWWMLVRHRLSPTYGDNVLNLDRATLFVSIIRGYKIDVPKLIVRDIFGPAVSTDTSLTFLYFFMQLCLD